MELTSLFFKSAFSLVCNKIIFLYAYALMHNLVIISHLPLYPIFEILIVNFKETIQMFSSNFIQIIMLHYLYTLQAFKSYGHIFSFANCLYLILRDCEM